MLHARTVRRTTRERGFPLHRLGLRLDERMVFVVGCPRSGTSFTAGALGSVRGFADLGEVNLLKAATPHVYLQRSDSAEHDRLVAELRRILTRTQRLALVAGLRAIEQTPESSYLIPLLAEAFPQAHFLHLQRDPRDVAASLIDRGWLAGTAEGPVTARAEGNVADDAGQPFGGYARFWVEPERAAEFEAASEERRCGWAWRCYVGAVREAFSGLQPGRCTTVRYEDLAHDPATVAAQLAADLGCEERQADLERTLGRVHARSVGRHRDLLDGARLDEVLAEAGPLARDLGYLSD